MASEISDQHRYLDKGVYDRFLRDMTPSHLRYLHREGIFFEDNIAPGSAVLDVGCGKLRTAIPIAVHIGPQGKVFAIDNHQRTFEEAVERAKVLKNVEVFNADARDLEQLHDTFDVILFPYEFLGLLPESDQIPVLQKAKGKLKPRGKILATVFSEYAPPENIRAYQMVWPPRKVFTKGNRVYGGDGYSAQNFTRKEIRKVFSSADLKPEVGRLTEMAYWVRANA